MEYSSIQKSQLYRDNFLPGALTRMRNNAYVRIMGVRNNDISLADVDKDQLVEAARKFVADWETTGGTVDESLREALQYNRVIVQAPSEIYASPFPLLLKCNTCNVIDFYDPRLNDDQVMDSIRKRIVNRAGRSYVSCKMRGCGGHMHQLPYVSVHRCGTLTPIHVPPTARRRFNIGFRDEGGSFFSNSFVDIDTKETLGKALQDKCPGCHASFPDADETHKRGTPITGGDAYKSQLLQYIALSKNAGNLVSSVYAEVKADAGAMIGLMPDIAEGLASTLLSITDSRQYEEHLRSVFAPTEDSKLDIAAIREKIAKLERQREKMAKYAEDDDMSDVLAEKAGQIDEWKQKLEQAEGRFKSVRTLIPDNRTLLDIVNQRRSLEAVLLRYDVNHRTVEQAIDEATDVIAKEAMAEQWKVVRDQYGVSSISHIPDLLVVLSAIGFTRERKMASKEEGVAPVQLNGFEDANDDTLRGKSCVYAMSARTEALWIKMDPCKVLRWCVENAGWESPDPATLESPQAAHAHLLRHSPALTMQPGEVAKAERDRLHLESAPFHLLHSISHALLANARRHTGYDDKSLTEYLLPMDLSFVIYVTSVQNYTSGGLLTMFNHYLRNWFDDSSLFAFNCAFDPICSDNGGACNGCLQTELGCETFNYGLSRSYLHGGMLGRAGQSSIPIGFWTDV
jgi:hypothetical protein